MYDNSYIALKPIQVDSKIKLLNISDKTSSLSCHMFHGKDFALATVKFFNYGWSFQDLATSMQQRIGVNVFTFHCTHIKDN